MGAAFDEMTQLRNKRGPYGPEKISAHDDLPVGSGLLIAFSLGLSGWYVIARMIAWLAHALT